MTAGAEQLKDWIGRRFPASTRPRRDAAEYFGWDESILSKFVNGERTPGLDNALLIESKTGIPVEAWASSLTDESKVAAAGSGRKPK